jgi:hypothetical protein
MATTPKGPTPVKKPIIPKPKQPKPKERSNARTSETEPVRSAGANPRTPGTGASLPVRPAASAAQAWSGPHT